MRVSTARRRRSASNQINQHIKKGGEKEKKKKQNKLNKSKKEKKNPTEN